MIEPSRRSPQALKEGPMQSQHDGRMDGATDSKDIPRSGAPSFLGAKETSRKETCAKIMTLCVRNHGVSPTDLMNHVCYVLTLHRVQI